MSYINRVSLSGYIDLIDDDTIYIKVSPYTVVPVNFNGFISGNLKQELSQGDHVFIIGVFSSETNSRSLIVNCLDIRITDEGGNA